MAKNMITSVGAIIIGIIYTIMATRLPELAVGDSLGPKIFPLIIGIVITLLGVILFVKEMLIPKENREKLVFQITSENRSIIIRIILTSIIGIVYGFVLDSLGYLLATAIFMFFIMMIINHKSKWLQNIVVAVVFSIVTYVSFGVLLHLSLPRGILYF